jgi:hypothetical protein
MRIQVSKRKDFARVDKWIKVCIILYNMFRSFHDERDDEEPEEDDEPEVAEEPNFGTFNLRQRIQSRLLDWYLNIHYA